MPVLTDGWGGREASPAGAWPVSGRPGTIGQVVKAIGFRGAGGRGVCAQSLQAPTMLTCVPATALEWPFALNAESLRPPRGGAGPACLLLGAGPASHVSSGPRTGHLRREPPESRLGSRRGTPPFRGFLTARPRPPACDQVPEDRPQHWTPWPRRACRRPRKGLHCGLGVPLPLK